MNTDSTGDLSTSHDFVTDMKRKREHEKALLVAKKTKGNDSIEKPDGLLDEGFVTLKVGESKMTLLGKPDYTEKCAVTSAAETSRTSAGFMRDAQTSYPSLSNIDHARSLLLQGPRTGLSDNRSSSILGANQSLLEGALSGAGSALARRAALIAQHQILETAARIRHQQQSLFLQNPAASVMIPRATVNSSLFYPSSLALSNPSIFQPVNHHISIEPSTLSGGTAWISPTSMTAAPLPTGIGDDEKQHSPVDLYMRCDDELLSDHQILLRKQIEYFEVGPQEIQAISHGRRREIHLGQVGIRCKRCASLPPRNRPKGAVYYPSSLRALYQAAQNMAASHFTISCETIGEDLKQQFQAFQSAKASAGHGGKKYWSDCARAVGVMEAENYLVFKK